MHQPSSGRCTPCLEAQPGTAQSLVMESEEPCDARTAVRVPRGGGPAGAGAGLRFDRILIFLFFLTINTQKLLADEIFQKGKEIFLEQGTCASCHALSDAGSDANIGPNLDEIRPDLNRIIMAVKNGIGVMPAFDGMLSEEEINAVSHYVYKATE